MDFGKEFRQYAVKHHGMSGMHLDSYLEKTNGGTMMPMGFTPYVIEERPLNIAQLDVFSRMMMDRIIFMGVPVSDYSANVIQAQMLFMESLDPQRDV